MDIMRMMRSLRARVDTIITTGVVTRVDDTKGSQELQVELRAGEVADAVRHAQPYGVSFVPTTGSEVVVHAVGASQSHLVGTGVENRGDRPTGKAAGEGGLYQGSNFKVFIDAAGILHLSTDAGTQSYVRGEDLLQALDDYAANVSAAVGLITAAPVAGLVTTAATGLLDIARTTLNTAVTAALSQNIKGE